MREKAVSKVLLLHYERRGKASHIAREVVQQENSRRRGVEDGHVRAIVGLILEDLPTGEGAASLKARFGQELFRSFRGLVRVVRIGRETAKEGLRQEKVQGRLRQNCVPSQITSRDGILGLKINRNGLGDIENTSGLLRWYSVYTT